MTFSLFLGSFFFVDVILLTRASPIKQNIDQVAVQRSAVPTTNNTKAMGEGERERRTPCSNSQRIGDRTNGEEGKNRARIGSLHGNRETCPLRLPPVCRVSRTTTSATTATKTETPVGFSLFSLLFPVLSFSPSLSAVCSARELLFNEI